MEWTQIPIVQTWRKLRLDRSKGGHPMDKNEAELTAQAVDVHEWTATENDEEQVLHELYGHPDDDGIYRGGEVL